MNRDWDRRCDRSRRQWVVIENHGNPLGELVSLYRDMAIARARVEEALENLAHLHGIKNEHVAATMDRYADDLLNAVVCDLKYQLSGELEAQSSTVLEAGPHHCRPRFIGG